MSLRKLKATRIFDGTRFLEDHVLLLEEDGTVEALVPTAEAPDAEVLEGILTPGFINCHCHLELSHMKGQLPERTGLVDFVLRIISQRAQDPAFIAQSIEQAAAEMERNGIVAVGDISNTADTADEKRSGRLRFYNFVEVLGWMPQSASGSFERALAVQESFRDCGPVAIVPHASYTVSSELWQRIAPHFAGRTISIHNQETPSEDEFFLSGGGLFPEMYAQMKIDNSHHEPTGRSSLQSYFDRLAAAERRLLIHNTFTTESDVRYALGNSPAGSTFFCLCINANLYIEDRVPPVDLLRRLRAPIVLGTDSLASNWQLGIHDEMKAVHTHFPDVPLEELLQWATLNGAKALQMDDELGSFEKGKKPGVVLLRESDWSVRRIV
ncbi:amidohydrolase family protein [Flaviaesturariibacter terrae]